MTNEESGLGGNRRTPRQGVGGSPVGSWLTVGLAAVALVIGFLILKNLNDDGGSGTDGSSSVGAETDTSTPGGGSGPDINIDVPVSEAPPASVAPPAGRVTTGASVLVANANSVGKSAGAMTKTLQVVGYTMLDPVDATGDKVVVSVVYFDPGIAGADAVANSVAADLGGVAVESLPTPPPVAGGDLGDAGVLVLLGDDAAGKTLEELAGTSADATGAAPTPAGGDTPTSAPPAADTTQTTAG